MTGLTRRLSAAVAVCCCIGVMVTAAGQTQGSGGVDRSVTDVIDARDVFEGFFGPLPAVAATPFFGLAVITGAALMVDASVNVPGGPWLQRHLGRNPLIAQTRKIATWWLFVLLSMLALVSYLSNSGKVQGVVGKGIHLVEGTVLLVVYAGLLSGSFHDIQRVSPTALAINAAAMPGFVVGMLSPTALAYFGLLVVSLYAMIVTRLAIDFLIWLTPIPFVDFVFESAKKVFSFGLLLLYFFAPSLALVISLLVLIASLLMFRWAMRWIRFGWSILLNPLVTALVPAAQPRIRPLDTVGHADAASPRLGVRAVALAMPGVKNREAGVLAMVGAEPCFVRQRWPRRATVHPFAAREGRTVLARTLLWTELQTRDAAGTILGRIAISKAVPFDTLRDTFAAVDGGDTAAMLRLKQVERGAHDGVSAIRDTVSSVLGPAISGPAAESRRRQ
jgi:hypothetical protein